MNLFKNRIHNVRWGMADVNCDREVNWLTIRHIKEVVFYSTVSEKLEYGFKHIGAHLDTARSVGKPGGKDAHAVIWVGDGNGQD